eukprot:9451421-Pyramimonas_sp.AAC.1
MQRCELGLLLKVGNSLSFPEQVIAGSLLEELWVLEKKPEVVVPARGSFTFLAANCQVAAGPGAWLPSVSQYAWRKSARSASAELRQSSA